MLIRTVVFCVLLAGVPALAEPVFEPPIGGHAGRDDSYPARDAFFPGGVIGKSSLVYAQPSGFRPLVLDLYLPPRLPARPVAGFPLVVFVHGGGWVGGDRRHLSPFADFPGVLAELASRGYVVASLDYRLSGEARAPAQIQDVNAALRWLRSHALDYDIDPSRIAVWGASAGGQIASLAAVGCNVPAFEPPATPDVKADAVAEPIHECVQGAVAWYGVFDFSTIAVQARRQHAFSRDVTDTPEWRLLGCYARTCRRGQMLAASPVGYVDPGDPPMLLIVGDKDATVPSAQTLEMADRLAEYHVPHELIVIPGVYHSFIGLSDEETRAANWRALDATFRFFDQALKGEERRRTAEQPSRK